MNLLSTSIEYYDKYREFYQSFFDQIKFCKINRKIKDTEHSIIHFYDKNKNKIVSSRFEIIGVYYPIDKHWFWAWALPNIAKNRSFISRKVLNYGLDINTQEKNNNTILQFLKSFIITSRTKLQSKLQLDMCLAINLYISKKKIIIPYLNDPKNHHDFIPLSYTFDDIDNDNYDSYPQKQISFIVLLDEKEIDDKINKMVMDE